MAKGWPVQKASFPVYIPTENGKFRGIRFLTRSRRRRTGMEISMKNFKNPFCIVSLFMAFLLVFAVPIGAGASSLRGDVNLDGQITITDLAQLNEYLVGARELYGQAVSNADVNGDGIVSSTDALLLKSIIAGIITPFPEPGGNMTTSTAGINYIKGREGAGHYDAYLDSAGVWTIGYGHTDGVTPGMHISGEQEALELLRQDLSGVERTLNDFIQNNGIVLTQNQFDALVSFLFNAGTEYLTSSAYKLHNTLLRYRNGSSIPITEAFRMIGAVHHVNGYCEEGLFYRRCEEGAMFYFGYYDIRYDWRTDYSWWGYSCADKMPDDWYPYEYGYGYGGSVSYYGQQSSPLLGAPSDSGYHEPDLQGGDDIF